MKLKINKLHGAGNTFIITTDKKWYDIKEKAELIKKICNATEGLAADGFIFLKPTAENSFAWDFYNSDASPAEMCGNAVRCVAAFLQKEKQINFGHIKTLAGNISFESLKNSYRVLMLADKKIKKIAKNAYFINTGVPHVVVIDFDDEKEEIKKYRNYNNSKNEKGCNVTLVNTKNNLIEAKTYERGVEGFTLACGTGAVAAAIVYSELYKTKDLPIQMPGGLLRVTSVKGNIYLEGQATWVLKGEYYNV